MFQLAVAEAYFDDEHHYRQMKALCSFSHPSLTDSNGRCVQSLFGCGREGSGEGGIICLGDVP